MRKAARSLKNIVARYAKLINIPFGTLFAFIGLVFLGIFLIRNIYLNIDIWLTNYQLKDTQAMHLERVKSENERLNKAVEYYKSNFYQQKYARESLNLARPNQKLYLVERKQEYDFLQEPVKQDRVEISDNREWWLRLLL